MERERESLHGDEVLERVSERHRERERERQRRETKKRERERDKRAAMREGCEGTRPN